jgi:voltage-gated potassium channel
VLAADDLRAARLAAWEHRILPYIVASAIVPLVVAFGSREGPVVNVVNIVSWGVFFADLVVHVRLRRGYLRTGWGVFDLVVVIGTFPWYLLPGPANLALVGLLRLGRLIRLAVIAVRTPAVRALLQRLGAPALIVTTMVLVVAAIVMNAEGPERYPTYGDAVWWAVVTVTTVGYGDYVPVTSTGRTAAGVLMLTGVALLGTVAASLATFLQDLKTARAARGEADPGDGGTQEEGDAASSPTGAVAVTTEASELRALRETVESLRAEVARLGDRLERR